MVVFKTIIGFIKFFVMNFNVTDEAVVGLIKGIVSHDTETFDASSRSFNIVLA